jgi:hypothetical protein
MSRYYIKKIEACGHCPNFFSDYDNRDKNAKYNLVKNSCAAAMYRDIEDSSFIQPWCPLPNHLNKRIPL